MIKLSVTNTMSGKKELFVPLEARKVKMYVCGITPYDYAHLGHGRCYVTFDLLYRFLKFLKYDVTYCRNFTDIDDKLLDRAQHQFGDRMRYHEVAQRFMNAFHEDMKSLNCLSPDIEPLATKVIPEIIEIIEGLIANGKAYASGGDVYYSVRSFDTYGALSKRKLEDLQAGARVEINELKKDPLDFALWKSEPEGTFWKSPWGWGRPGWHIECSAMVLKYLGKQIDIHGGGMDLIFPHHENERAQSEGLLDLTFVKYWMHNAFITINQEKMSKSLGNFFTLRDIFQKFPPMVIRYYFLTHYYRAPLEFSFDDLEVAQKTYQRLCKVFADHNDTISTDISYVSQSPITQQMLEFIADDLNTPGMLGVLFENLSIIKENDDELYKVKAILQNILGLDLIPLPEKTVTITPEIQQLIDEREQARVQKNWKRADEIRDQLKAMGVEVHDKKC